jgi:hypothetical protein
LLVLCCLGTPAWAVDDHEQPAAPSDETVSEAPSASSETDDDSLEVVVYGEHLVNQARAKLAKDLRQQGFDQVIRRDGATTYRHSALWKGEIAVYDDGWIRMKRQPVQFKPPAGLPLIPSGSKLAWVSCVIVPLCVRAGGQTVSRTKMLSQRRRTLRNIEPRARVYGDRVADLHVDQTLATLPDRLMALWEDGAPFTPPVEGTLSPDLRTPDARRRVILDYWESRTDTRWGSRVRAAIEAFIREEIQYSPFPYTDVEVAAFNKRRTCEPELDLNRDWQLVLADLESRAGE